MKSKIIALAIVAIACISGGGAMAATASAAANCDIAIGRTYYNAGNWHFQFQAQNCTDVDLVEFSRTGPPSPGSGWRDSTKVVDHIAPAAYNVNDYLFGSQYGVLVNSSVGTWNIPPWCAAAGYAPGSSFSGFEAVTYRIHNRVNQTWGSWHGLANTNALIGC